MKNTFLLFTFIVMLASILSCSSIDKFTINVASESECTNKKGYWYSGKCWSDYKDEGIAKEDIDRVVAEQMQLIDAAKITFDGKEYPLLSMDLSPDEKITLVLIKFIDKENTIMMQLPMKELEAKKTFQNKAVYIIGNIEDTTKINDRILGVGEVQIDYLGGADLSHRVSGTLKSPKSDKTYPLSMVINEGLSGAGNSTVEFKGSEAIINGDLGTRGYPQMQDIIKNHPEVKTIVLGQINGSVNDAVNMHTGRILRAAGLTTKVLSNSSIASGGVDLFCAGKERIIEKGAKIGIHSWCCVNDVTAKEVPQDHPAHSYQIEYYSMCFGKELGTKFYFHTLAAAPFSDVHWMSDAELEEWKVPTQFIK